MTKLVVVVALIAVGLSGCAGLQEKVDAVEKGVVEPGVDRTVTEIVKRLCSLPVDVTKRAVENRTVPGWNTMADLCPDTWRAVRDALRAGQ